MKKKVLVLNGTISEIPVVKRLKEMGYYVITTGNNPDLPAHKYSDEYISCDYSNCEKILQLVKNKDIYRVVSCANDFGAITAAYVSDKMGWNHHDNFDVTEMLHHKDTQKAYFAELGIRSPLSTAFRDKMAAYDFIKTVDYPIMVKSSDMTGGKGVNRADNEDEAIAAIDEAMERSRRKVIVIEPFIFGKQETLCAFIKGKKVISAITFNAYSPLNPYLIQSEYAPSDDNDRLLPELTEMVEKISRKANLSDGVVVFQYIVSNGEPYIIEMMRRNLGNQAFFLAQEITGFPWFDMYIRSEMGLEIPDNISYLPVKYKFVGHHGITSKKNGKAKTITVDPKLSSNIIHIEPTFNENEEIDNIGIYRGGWVFYACNTRKDISALVKELNDLIYIEISE